MASVYIVSNAYDLVQTIPLPDISTVNFWDCELWLKRSRVDSSPPVNDQG